MVMANFLSMVAPGPAGRPSTYVVGKFKCTSNLNTVLESLDAPLKKVLTSQSKSCPRGLIVNKLKLTSVVGSN